LSIDTLIVVAGHADRSLDRSVGTENFTLESAGDPRSLPRRDPVAE
jgi:hypothetical protein